MVKHTQTIRRQIADELSMFDHSVGLALKRLMAFSFLRQKLHYRCLTGPK